MSDNTRKSSESAHDNEATAPEGSKEDDLEVSFQTFGEETSVPIDIRKAAFAASNLAPFLNRFLASLELSVVNAAVRRSVSGKLRISLPVGSAVKRFEVLRDGSWYPAVAVPKKRAKEIVYREKERGRDVAAVSDVASGSNVFEIEVSPLPFGTEVKCRLECAFVGRYSREVFRQLARSFFPEEKTEVVVTTEEGEKTRDGGGGGGGGGCSAAVGRSFGKTHFVCRVPPPPPARDDDVDADAAPLANAIRRIAVVWDTSGSMAKRAERSSIVSERCDRLSELARECSKRNDGGAPVSFELYSFNVGDPNREGTFESSDDLSRAVRNLHYDGGTDITRLSSLFLRLSERRGEDDAAIDCALVFTDGMDNLGRLPPPDNLHSIPFPVHVIADSSEANLRCARALASLSPHRPGSVFLRNDESYVPGVLFPRAILRSITTDQSEEAFLEEVDDGFRCLPDHRLGRLNEPIGPDGLLISGMLGACGEMSAVSEVVAEVAFAGRVHMHHFRLRATQSSSSCDNVSDATTTNDGVGKEERSISHYHHYHHGILTLDSSIDKEGSSATNPSTGARLLGHIYAEERYRAAESFGLKAGMDLKDIQEELSVQYGFCSPESSLLMLYDMEQFKENGVLPPKGHPLFAAAEESKMRKKETPRHESDEVFAKGDIGGPKTVQERSKVVGLANQLNRYMDEKVVHGAESKRRELPVGSRDRGTRARGVPRSFLTWMHRAPAAEPQAPARGAVQQDVDETAQILRRSIDDVLERGVRLDELTERSNELERQSKVFCKQAKKKRSSGFSLLRRCRVDDDPPSMSPPTSQRPALETDGDRAFCVRSGFVTNGVPVGRSDEDGTSRGGDDAESVSSGPSPNGSEPCASPPARSDRSAVAPPKDPKLYMEKIEGSLKREGQGSGGWRQEYYAQKALVGNVGDASPSFYLNVARLVLENGHGIDAIRIATNCLEMRIEDVQMLRCVAYFLMTTKIDEGLTLARRLFDKVRDLQPFEPQSFLDSALVRFWALASSEGTDDAMLQADNRELEATVADVQDFIVRVLTHRWANRFDEVEWPALILLHYVADYVKSLNEKFQLTGSVSALPEWPTPKLTMFQHNEVADPLRCPNFDLALMVWCGWDTDNTDVDLHVVEPTKNEVYYGNRNSGIGGHLSRDFTQGMGPEVYVLKHREKGGPDVVGTYDIYAKYFASHQDSALTGTTSVLLWTARKDFASGRNKIDFDSVRLDTHKEKTKVKTVRLERMPNADKKAKLSMK